MKHIIGFVSFIPTSQFALWFLFDIVDSSEMVLLSMPGLEHSATHVTRKIKVEMSSFNVFL